jgi:hypothetical protein
MSDRFAGIVEGRNADIVFGLVVYSQLPMGVVFRINGQLFLKTSASYDGEHFLSFSLDDGNILEINPGDMVKIFSGTISIQPSLVPKT